VAVSFVGGGNRSTRRKPPTCRKSLIVVSDVQLPVQSVPFSTNVVSSNPVHGEVYSI
jgi:hypothetical protein